MGAEGALPIVAAISTAIGALIPIIRFFFMTGIWAVIATFAVSIVPHFDVRALKSLITIRSWWTSRLEITRTLLGMLCDPARAAVVVIYIVLGVLYESYIHPITILSTLPSAGVGALLALLICRIDFSLVALIGIILLIGIVKKNAIMMIDFALEAEREQGMSPEESIYQACLLRLRPIMMTTAAALLGALPLAGTQ